jgi:hypothetical protein
VRNLLFKLSSQGQKVSRLQLTSRSETTKRGRRKRLPKNVVALVFLDVPSLELNSIATRTFIPNDERIIHDFQMRNENPLHIFFNPKP